MKRLDIPVQLRERIGKGGARSARREGLLPGVVYGGGKDPISVMLNRHEFTKSLKGGESENVLVNLKFENDGHETLTLVRDTQHDPLRGDLEHVDFLRVSIDKAITTTVPLHTTGSAKGVKDGGVLEIVRREVEIECLPLDIPDFIEIDISGLGLGQGLHVSDIPANEKITILTSGDESIATVTAPSTVGTTVGAGEGASAAAPAAEEAAAEEED
ncbi:MAG: 50S ribosomal protein L25/general stress protein Ctc [bacterium]|nr:50S ribosomal protein L25/general stress protein Ctc [bacterium]